MKLESPGSKEEDSCDVGRGKNVKLPFLGLAVPDQCKNGDLKRTEYYLGRTLRLKSPNLLI